MFSKEDSYQFKIVLVGDAYVGKTSLMNRYIKGQVPKNYVATIGVEFASKLINLKSGQKAQANLWDTSGQERYRSIASSHYRKASGALVVYDITDEKTFNNISQWIDDIRQYADEDIVIILVGNKCDICEKDPSKRQVVRSRAQNLAFEYKCLFEETSSLENKNITSVFEKLLEEIYSTKQSMGTINKALIGELKLSNFNTEEQTNCC